MVSKDENIEDAVGDRVAELLRIYNAKLDLKFESIMHALSAHNDRLDLLEKSMLDAASWYKEDKIHHNIMSAKLDRIGAQIATIFDGVRMLSHVHAIGDMKDST